MSLKVNIIKKKTSFLSELNYPKSSLLALLVSIIGILCIAFVPSLIGKLLFVLLILIIILSKVISLKRYKILGVRDFEILGTLLLKEESIEFESETIKLNKDSIIKFLYGGVRNDGFGNRDISDGISEFEINDKRVSILIESQNDAKKLRKIFKSWYFNNISLDEESKATGFRLIELNPNWEWERLREINRA